MNKATTPSIRIPVPLNALRAFEVVSRRLSIKDAAEELGVTPSAVSHQLRTLEGLLGVELVRRVGTGLELTHAGHRLAPDLMAGFGHISEAVGALRQSRDEGPLRLHTLPAIAINWLAPRLESCLASDDSPSFEVTTSPARADLVDGAADVGLWFGTPPWEGLTAELLFPGTLQVYGQPAVLASSRRGRLSQLSQARLFVSSYCVNWQEWIQTMPPRPHPPAQVSHVDSCGLALQVASEGMAFCLVVAQLAAHAVAKRRLEPVVDHEVRAEGDFYLVYPDRQRDDPRLKTLRRWLQRWSQPEPSTHEVLAGGTALGVGHPQTSTGPERPAI